MIVPLVFGFFFSTLGLSQTVPIERVNGTGKMDPVASYNGLDGIQVKQPNGTSYEWWYFDALSYDRSKSVVFQPILYYEREEPLYLRVTFAYPNGTVTDLEVPSSKVAVLTSGAGSSGKALDGSYEWLGAPDMSEYTISMDLPELGVSGKIHLKSVAPAHGPCGAAVDGAPLELSWDLLWINAIPDAEATVDLNVNGTALTFTGTGYHDKNWGTSSFDSTVNQWYWGHGRAGDLSVVWFYHLNKQNETSTSAYIAQNNTIVHAACSGLTMRPFGPGVEYPVPITSNATIRGYDMFIDAGELGNYTFTLSSSHQLMGGAVVYQRHVGTIEGGLVGGTNVSGSAVWEQMGPF